MKITSISVALLAALSVAIWTSDASAQQPAGWAGAALYRVGAADGRVIELVDQHHAGALGVAGDSPALPSLAVLIGADVRGARCAHVGDRLNPFPLAPHDLNPGL
jgi:hypothetical protein